jgi:hypothetical protein
MPQAALVSASLHFLVALVLLTQAHYRKKPFTPPVTRHVVVDFIKIGPNSAAPAIGPQSVRRNKDSATKNLKPGEAPTLKEAPSTEVKPVNAKTAPDLPQKANPAPTIPSKPARQTPPAKKSGSNPPKKNPPENKDSAKKVSATTKKADQKKTPASSKSSRGVAKAKIDLAKKGSAVQSISDFLGKSGNGKLKKGAPAETLGNVLTGTDIDRLNQHMKNFWNMPSGHEKASQIVVEIRLSITPDCKVKKAIIIDQSRFERDADFRIAAECALRAVLDPECSPLPLPPEKYELWKDMIFEFNPSEMCES